MTMFEVKVYGTKGEVLRRSLVQALTYSHAMREAWNVFHHTPDAFTFEVE
jgi:hypothetical protein